MSDYNGGYNHYPPPQITPGTLGVGHVVSVQYCPYCSSNYVAGMIHVCQQKYQEEMRQREYQKAAMIKQQHDMESQAKKMLGKNFGVNPATKGDTTMAKTILSPTQKSAITYGRAKGLDNSTLFHLWLVDRLTADGVEKAVEAQNLINEYDPAKPEPEEDTKA